MNKNQWHLDKRVPITLILTIIIQTAGVFWWAAKLDQRVSALENATANNAQAESRLARIEESQIWIKEMVRSIARKLENGNGR